MSKWQEWGKLGGRPRNEEKIVVEARRNGRRYKYRVYRDEQGQRRKEYLGPVEEKENTSELFD